MHEVYFYRDKNGVEPVKAYMLELAGKADKDSRIKLSKLNDYIQMLSLYGTQAGEPYIKHLEGDVWELRPLRDRVLFVGWKNGGYVLLHCFMKKTQKTPQREIAQAKRELADLIERSNHDGTSAK